MKRIVFVDPRTEAFINCCHIVGKRLWWKWKVDFLTIGEKLEVYSNAKFNITISVCFEGYWKGEYSDGKTRFYTFWYQQGNNVEISYPFTLAGFKVFCLNYDMNITYQNWKRCHIKKKWVNKIESASVGSTVLVYSYCEYRGENVEDDEAPRIDTKLVILDYIDVKYIGNNPQNGHRQYVFVEKKRDWPSETEYKEVFEIVGKW